MATRMSRLRDITGIGVRCQRPGCTVLFVPSHPNQHHCSRACRTGNSLDRAAARDLVSPDFGNACTTCHGPLEDGTDQLGRATLTCRCGTALVRVQQPATCHRYDQRERLDAELTGVVTRSQAAVRCKGSA